jgi:hypothetical protein
LKARRAIFFARYEASQVPTGFIETEHLLLGLMREDVLLRIKLINEKGSAEGLKREIESGIATTDRTILPSSDLPLSHEAQRVLSLAAEEADHLSHSTIDSGHLVLGVFAIRGSAAEALVHQGVEREAYREALRARGVSTAPEVEPLEPPARAVDSGSTREVAAPSLRETVSKLDQLVDEVTSQLSMRSENVGYRRLKRKSWTRKEAVGHLIDWATTHHQWFARAIAEQRLVANAYPDDTWLAAQRYSEVPWMQLLGLWSSLNRLLIHVLAGIPEEKLQTSCRIGIETPRTLKELITGYIDHCEDMIGQMLAHG